MKFYWNFERVCVSPFKMSIENSKVINDDAFLMTCWTNASLASNVFTFFTLSLFLIDIFHIFNLSLANSSEIYNDSLPICFSGLYSNQLSKWPNQTEREKKLCSEHLDCRWWCGKSASLEYGSRALSRVFGGIFFTKHALMKINNKSFPLYCLMPAIIFYGFSHTGSCRPLMEEKELFLPVNKPAIQTQLWIEKNRSHARSIHNIQLSCWEQEPWPYFRTRCNTTNSKRPNPSQLIYN